MQKYNVVDVSEKQLEDLVRQGTDYIEVGLRYVDHQRQTDRGPLDVLMVDSGNSLVIAELKVVEDDLMLMQGIDYYDYLARNIVGITNAYKRFKIEPKQSIRLFLIAPSFSVSLLNRCKWIDIPISLFTYKCIILEGTKDVLPIFSEISIPTLPKPIQKNTIADRLAYITNPEAKDSVVKLMEKIKGWNSSKINIDPIKNDISLKFKGKVFAYISPRRQYFIVSTYDQGSNWTNYPIKEPHEFEAIMPILKANLKEDN